LEISTMQHCAPRIIRRHIRLLFPWFLVLALAPPLVSQGIRPQSSIRVQPLPTAPRRSARIEEGSATANPRAADVGSRLRGTLQALPSAPRGSALGALQREQRKPYLALKARIGAAPTVRVRRENGTLLELSGAILEPAAAVVAPGEDVGLATAQRFLRSNAGLLRLADPNNELRLERDTTDELGKRQLRYSQVWRGVPVWPADVLLELDAAGSVERMSGAYVPSPRAVGEEPAVLAHIAASIAASTLGVGPEAVSGAPALIVFAPGGREPRLAWRVEVAPSLLVRRQVIVDAANGAILESYNLVKTDGVAGSGVDLFGTTRPLHAFEEGGDFFLIDTSKPMFDPSSNPPNPNTTRGAIFVLDARNQPPNSDPETIPDLFQVVSDSATSWDPADGVSASFALSETYDYYLQRHNRNSLDGQGGTMLSVIRLGVNFQNAFWSGTLMAFGDAEPYAGALDVVAHELTHGVTDVTSNLVYKDQSGALNEALSDIFGEAVEHRTFGQNDWLIGSQLSEPVRNMEDPSAIVCCFGRNYPEKFSEFIRTTEDEGGVHINSSIINHAFYLLSDGLNGAVGIEDAEKIFYRAQTVKLTANARFIDARLACVSAAEDLFGAGSPQAAKTAQAFDTVEIFDGTGTPDPEPLPPVTGDDSTIFVFADPDTGESLLGRQETQLGDDANGEQLAGITVKIARPSVTGDGSIAAFVDATDDLCLVATGVPGSEECLGRPGSVASVAVSPSGDLFAFVLLEAGEPINEIAVVDLSPGGGTRSFPLFAPAPDGSDLGTVLFADAMDFTSDGRFLVYDALTQVMLDDGTQIDAWGIFSLDLVTEQILSIVPPTPGFDIGFPSLGQTRDDLLTFDAIDAETGNSTVLAADLITGELNPIASVEGAGVPGYTGDDAAIVFTVPDESSPTGFLLAAQPMAADGISPVGDIFIWIEDAAFGVVYRRGAFTPTIRDLAVIKIKAPKRITLTPKKPQVTKTVSVQVQNQGPDIEVITDLTMLRSLVSLSVNPLGGCAAPIASLRPPKKGFPISLKPKKKLTLVFDVTFSCAGDPLKSSSKDPGHEDYTFTATVDHSAIDGEDDTDPGDDQCPHSVAPPFQVDARGFKDKGCGNKKPDRTLGADILTDVVVK